MSGKSQAESQLLRKSILHPLRARMGCGADVRGGSVKVRRFPSIRHQPAEREERAGSLEVRRLCGVFQAPALGPQEGLQRRQAGSSVF